MEFTSTKMHALVAAASICEWMDGIILSGKPESEWRDEVSGGGNSLEALELQPPPHPGLWVWEGVVVYPDVEPEELEGYEGKIPEWNGNWRIATDEEILAFAHGKNPWDKL
jgi:hypothetical protein